MKTARERIEEVRGRVHSAGLTIDDEHEMYIGAIEGAVTEERARWMECYDADLFRWNRIKLERVRVAIEKEMEEEKIEYKR